MKIDRLLASAGAALFAGLSSASEIQGTVIGPNGPEAGVWVIAETTELPTKFARIVVSDEKGRYLVPDLPKAEYEVWVRGYGLIDSPKLKASPGAKLQLTAVPAPSEREAAQYYPSMYWFAMLRVPPESEFPLGPMASQGAWLHGVKDLFGKASPKEAMAQGIGVLGEAGLKYFAQWADEIEKGAMPTARPERPQGVARNLVVTTWEWSRPKHSLHDLVSTDRRNPSFNAHGRLYGSPEETADLVPILDPKTHSSSSVVHPVRDPRMPSASANPMLDEKGHVWFTSRIAPALNPEYCKGGSKHPSAQAFPLDGEAERHLAMYDPKRGDWKLVRTCFPTHHLSFGFDDDNTVWTSSGNGGASVLGWLNRRVFEQTGDAAKAQGWTPFVLDTNGDGRRGAYVEPQAPVDPKKDKRIAVNLYSVAVSPLDNAVWGTVAGYPGGVVRVVPGSDPARTALSEYYEVPLPGYGPRGGDVDTNGVYWVSLASGHLGRFVRASCKATNGPSATGRHCREGWTFYPLPGPQMRDVKAPGSAEVSYSTWVDWFGTLGLGKNVPIAIGHGADAVHALVKGKFVTLHIPYPQGVFPKNVDGRIDSDTAGWKGRGLWTTSGTRTLLQSESGNDARPKVVKLQMRPSPLAK